MPSYNYVAIDQKGHKLRGVVMADNEQDLEERLKQLKLDLVSANKSKVKKASRFSSVRPKDLIIACMHLEQLDRAGVPLHDALADVRDSSESARLRDVLTGVYESVKNGNLLSKALEAYPKIFGNVFIGLVAAGEKTGNLAESFMHLAEHLKWTSELHRKIKKATRYPLAVLIMLTIVITFMMLFVVPKLVDFIISQGFTLPLHTRALIAVSQAFQHYWHLILGTPIVLIIIGVVLYRSSFGFAYKIDTLILRLPLIGPVIRKIEMARFTHFFSVIFNSGIDVLEALESARSVVNNKVLQDSVELVKVNVTEGNSLTNSLKLSNHFPMLVIRMFKVGEDSGNMADALENINFFYSREVNDAVENMVGAIQPILISVMGLLMFWIIAAVFGPLYESFSKMNF